MDVRPNDHILEIRCGPGAGAELICSRLEPGGCSPSTAPSPASTAPGGMREVHRGPPLTVRQIDLATLRSP